MSFLILLLLSCAGMLALSLAMPAHHAQMFGKNSRWPQSPWLWRPLGLALLMASLAVAVNTWGVTIAVATVVSATTVSCMLIIPALSYWPRRFALALLLALLLAPMLSLMRA